METESMTSKPKIVLRKEILWLQWTGCIATMLLLFVSGMMGGWTSPYLARLTAEDSPIPLTSDEASWVASFLNLGRLLGAIPGAVCVHYLGSKRTLIMNNIPFIIGWVSIIMADSVGWLYVARLVNGLSLGMTFSSFPLYLGEISDPSIRGTLVTLATTGLPVGTLAGNFIGANVSMSVFVYISMIPTIMCLILLFWIPESPHHLVRINNIEQAKNSIAKYHPGINVEAEVKSLQDFIGASKSVTLADKLREFNIPQNRKAGMIVIVLYLFMQLSGVNSVLFYIEIILTDGELTVIKPANMVIMGAVAGIMASLVAVYLADKFGRRTLLMGSSIGVATSMAVLGAHFAFLESDFEPAGLQWMTIFSVLLYEVSFFGGLCPVPSMVLSELFAPNIKSIAACFGSISVGFFSFLSTKTYQPMLNAMGETYVFWLYGGFMVIVVIFALTVMPETKGKSLQEIQRILHRKKETVNFNYHIASK